MFLITATKLEYRAEFIWWIAQAYKQLSRFLQNIQMLSLLASKAKLMLRVSCLCLLSGTLHVWSVRSTRFRSISIPTLPTLSCSRTCVGESLASADVTSHSSHPTTTSTSSRRPPLTGSTTRCAASKRLSSDRHRCATGQNYGDQESSARCNLRKHLHLFDSTCAASTHNTTKYNTL